VKREVHTGFCFENVKESGHFEGIDVDGCIVLKWLLKKCDGQAWSGFCGSG
jgi:hypothetical protein